MRGKNGRSFSCQDVPIISCPLLLAPPPFKKVSRKDEDRTPCHLFLPLFFVLTHRSSYLWDRCDKSHYPSLPLPLRPTPINSFLNPLLLSSILYLFVFVPSPLLPSSERTSNGLRSVQGVGCAFNWGGLFFCALLRVASARFFPFLSWAIFGFWVTGPRFPESLFHLFARCPPIAKKRAGSRLEIDSFPFSSS